MSFYSGGEEKLGIEVVAPSVATGPRRGVRRAQNVQDPLCALCAHQRRWRPGTVEHLVDERTANGPFASLTDFFSAASTPHQINKRTLESLIAMPARLDCFGASDGSNVTAGLHSAACSATPPSVAAPNADRIGHSATCSAVTAMHGETIQLPFAETWLTLGGAAAIMNSRSIGFYFSAHPLDEYRRRHRLTENAGAVLAPIRRAGAVKNGRVEAPAALPEPSPRNRSGKHAQRQSHGESFTVSDPSGQFEIVAFSENPRRMAGRAGAGPVVLLQCGGRI